MEASMSQPLTFDFITDEDLRSVLRSDYREMVSCASVKAWKAVQVLAGSIIEAVLVDYLVGTAETKRPDPLGMGLADLISAGKKAGILTKKSSELSGALKEYRNLIHPGRSQRLGERADQEGAVVAQALVRLIAAEVAKKQASEHGLTAEQITRKFMTDPTAPNISVHLLRDANGREVERLLLVIVPDAYIRQMDENFGDPGDEVLGRLVHLYHAAFNAASDNVRRKAMTAYIKELKESAGPRVEIYERHFFRSPYLRWVADDEREMIKGHLLSQLEEGDPAIYVPAKGIGAFLGEDEVGPFVDTLVRRTVRHKGTQGAEVAKTFLESESLSTSRELDPLVVSRLDMWIRAYKVREGHDDLVDYLESMKAGYEIPF
jgi:hypothetical protein